MSFLAALQLLTSIPVRIRREMTPAQLGKAAAWFPLVGLVIGGILAGLDRLLAFVLPPAVVGALVVAALAMLTGAMHLDGLADTCDGLAGARPVEERWRIMHDSRTGALGVVGIVLVLLVKYVSLTSLPAGLVLPALVFMPVASRWAMVYAIFAFPGARPEGLGAAYKQGTRWPQFAIATMLTVAIAAALFPWFSFTGLIVIFGVCIITTLLALYLKHKLAGLTGDTYGAVNEVAEAAALLIVVALGTASGGYLP